MNGFVECPQCSPSFALGEWLDGRDLRIAFAVAAMIVLLGNY